MLLVYPVWRIAMPARIDLQSPSPVIARRSPTLHVPSLPSLLSYTHTHKPLSFPLVYSNPSSLSLSLSLPPSQPLLLLPSRRDVLVFILLVASVIQRRYILLPRGYDRRFVWFAPRRPSWRTAARQRVKRRRNSAVLNVPRRFVPAMKVERPRFRR